MSDTRVVAYDPLLSPAAPHDELPLNDANQAVVEQTRAEIRAVLDGEDDRRLMVMGPCSVHDPVAAVDYAGRLGALGDELRDYLMIVMRVFSKNHER